MAFNKNDTKTIPCNNVSNQKGMTLQKDRDKQIYYISTDHWGQLQIWKKKVKKKIGHY